MKQYTCQECGEKFEAYRDEYGDLETLVCRNCDFKHYEGSIEDRDRMDD